MATQTQTATDTEAPRQTEARLLDVALTLFAQRGYAATSVRQIIEAAGVTRPVLYYYFDSKEDLFSRLVRTRYEDSCAALAAAVENEPDAVAGLRAIVRESFRGSAADPRVPRIMFQTYYGPPVEGMQAMMDELSSLRFLIVCGVMQRGLDAGELTGGDAGALALAFCCLMDQHINVLSRLPNPASRLTDGLADALVDLFIHGAEPSADSAVAFPPFAGDPSRSPDPQQG